MGRNPGTDKLERLIDCLGFEPIDSSFYESMTTGQ